MDKNLVAHLKNLTTIKDFDLAVGGCPREFLRVPELTTNVAKSDVDFIIWLLLEKEFGINGTTFKEEEKSSSSSLEDRRTSTGSNASSDATDASTSTIYAGRIQTDGHKSYRNLSKREQALRYAEDLLAAVGVNIPFERLTPEQRRDLFKLFYASSNLLVSEKFSSILDLYSALRRRSKFREEFTILGRLGSGSFGTVYSVRRTAVKNKLALKKVILNLDLLDLIPMILNESSILKAVVGNENVVKYYDSWFAIERTDEDESCAESAEFMHHQNQSQFGEGDSFNSGVSSLSERSAPPVHEYEEGTYTFYLLMEQYWISLRQWRTNFPQELLSHEQLRQIALGLIEGIEWIHSKGYLHLDINPKNLLWKSESRTSVVISDFGLAVMGPTFGERAGTAPYCAPERILSTKSDVYSLGMSLFEISQHFSTISEFIHKLETRDLMTGAELLDEMLPIMLQHRPQQRLTASELKAKFFGGES